MYLIGGLDSLPVGGHPLRASCSTFGRPEGGYRPDPLNFIKKGHIYRQPIKILHRNMSEVRKPPVPSMRDKPIMGLSSCKNYIIENAVDAILQGRRKYGNISHKRVFDTINSLARKERLEKELQTVENDLQNLSNSSVIVDYTKTDWR